MLDLFAATLCRFLTFGVLWITIAPPHNNWIADGVGLLGAAAFWTLGNAFERRD